MDSVDRINIVDEGLEVPFVTLSESSLLKEWGSEEDNVFDDWAKTQILSLSPSPHHPITHSPRLTLHPLPCTLYPINYGSKLQTGSQEEPRKTNRTA